MVTYMDCNTVELATVTAATRMNIGSVTIPQGKSGTIKKIFLAIANIADAKSCAGYIEVIVGKSGGPFNFVVGGGGGSATYSVPLMNAQEIGVSIPVLNNEKVDFWCYFTDAQVNAHAGIQWVV